MMSKAQAYDASGAFARSVKGCPIALDRGTAPESRPSPAVSCRAGVMWQAEVIALRERLADARRQAKADEEIMRWLNAQARMLFMPNPCKCLGQSYVRLTATVAARGMPQKHGHFCQAAPLAGMPAVQWACAYWPQCEQPLLANAACFGTCRCQGMAWKGLWAAHHQSSETSHHVHILVGDSGFPSRRSMMHSWAAGRCRALGTASGRWRARRGWAQRTWRAAARLASRRPCGESCDRILFLCLQKIGMDHAALANRLVIGQRYIIHSMHSPASIVNLFVVDFCWKQTCRERA